MDDYWEVFYYGFTIHHHDLLGRTTHGICGPEMDVIGTVWQGADWAAGLLGLCPRRTAVSRVAVAMWLNGSRQADKKGHDISSAETVKLSMDGTYWLLTHHHMKDRVLPLILAPQLEALNLAWLESAGQPVRLLIADVQSCALPADVAKDFRRLSGDNPQDWLRACEAARITWRHKDRMEEEEVIDRFGLLLGLQPQQPKSQNQ